MNILPKKRWHVRTRENIARVRRDEALAAEEEKKRLERIELAEKEARTELLRYKAREKHGYIPPLKKEESNEPLASNDGHINFFYELERKEAASTKTNAEHEKEAKAEKEKEEMKIGYLTYLGQDTNELTGNVSWYNKIPERRKAEESEVGVKEKLLADPLKDIRKYLDLDGLKTIHKPYVSASSDSLSSKKRKREKSRRKHKKEKKTKESKSKKLKKAKKRTRSSSSSSNSSNCSSKKVKKARTSSQIDIEKLREERIRRERVERERAALALAKLRGELGTSNVSPPPSPEYTQKYSSQFNPHLARQNFST